LAVYRRRKNLASHSSRSRNAGDVREIRTETGDGTGWGIGEKIYGGRRATSRSVVRRRIEDFTRAFVRRLTGVIQAPRLRRSQCVPGSADARMERALRAPQWWAGSPSIQPHGRVCEDERTRASGPAAGDGCRSARWCAVIKQTLEVLDILRARHAAEPL
jgi:hypothetical protein